MIQTVYSEAAAGRDTPRLLTDFTEFASAVSLEGILFDGNNVPGASGSAANCYIGAKFTDGFVGILDEMRFFMDYFPSKATFEGNLIFQGSNDDFSTVNDIVTIDSSLHEGWNYFDLSKETYNSYRLFNAQANGCDSIGELKLFGQKVIDETAPNLICPVEIVDVSTDVATLVD